MGVLGNAFKMNVLISTIWNGERVPFVVQEKKPDKIIFLMDKDDTRKKAYERMKEIFESRGKIIDRIDTTNYDLYEITKKVNESIKKEVSAKNEISVCISEAMKPMSLSVMYAAYLHKNVIKAIYYVMHGTGEIISYPFLDFNLRNGRKNVLKAIGTFSKNNSDKIGIDEIMNKSGLKKSAVYENLKELIRMGYVDKKTNNLTVFGKICLLN